MSATYLLRFDDICPTINWDAWEHVEALLYKYNAKPLLAVVPRNCDPNLERGQANPKFWSCVRRWQSDGWGIGLHGYQHLYTTTERGIWGRSSRSEFAGVRLDEQEVKLRSGMEIFDNQGVTASAWIAPSHSFDRNTLIALKRVGLTVINDGYFLGPRIDSDGFTWVPQQLGALRDMPLGLWTVCLHANSWGTNELQRLEKFLSKHQREITGLDEILRDEPFRAIGQVGDKMLSLGIRAVRRLRGI